MFGEKALELVKELKRSGDSSLPPYNEDGVRKIWTKYLRKYLLFSYHLIFVSTFNLKSAFCTHTSFIVNLVALKLFPHNV